MACQAFAGGQFIVSPFRVFGDCVDSADPLKTLRFVVRLSYLQFLAREVIWA